MPTTLAEIKASLTGGPSRPSARQRFADVPERVVPVCRCRNLDSGEHQRRRSTMPDFAPSFRAGGRRRAPAPAWSPPPTLHGAAPRPSPSAACPSGALALGAASGAQQAVSPCPTTEDFALTGAAHVAARATAEARRRARLPVHRQRRCDHESQAPVEQRWLHADGGRRTRRAGYVGNPALDSAEDPLLRLADAQAALVEATQ